MNDWFFFGVRLPPHPEDGALVVFFYSESDPPPSPQGLGSPSLFGWPGGQPAAEGGPLGGSARAGRAPVPAAGPSVVGRAVPAAGPPAAHRHAASAVCNGTRGWGLCCCCNFAVAPLGRHASESMRNILMLPCLKLRLWGHKKNLNQVKLKQSHLFATILF